MEKDIKEITCTYILNRDIWGDTLMEVYDVIIKNILKSMVGEEITQDEFELIYKNYIKNRNKLSK